MEEQSKCSWQKHDNCGAETCSGDSKSEKPDSKSDLTWRKKQDLKLRRNRAYTTIYQSLSSEFKPLIYSTTKGIKAWKILHDHFKPITRARWFSCWMSSSIHVPGENLGLFLCHVKEAAECLCDVDHQLQPLYLGHQIIRSISDEFHATFQTIYRWSDVEFPW